MSNQQQSPLFSAEVSQYARNQLCVFQSEALQSKPEKSLPNFQTAEPEPERSGNLFYRNNTSLSNPEPVKNATDDSPQSGFETKPDGKNTSESEAAGLSGKMAQLGPKANRIGTENNSKSEQTFDKREDWRGVKTRLEQARLISKSKSHQAILHPARVKQGLAPDSIHRAKSMKSSKNKCSLTDNFVREDNSQSYFQMYQKRKQREAQTRKRGKTKSPKPGRVSKPSRAQSSTFGKESGAPGQNKSDKKAAEDWPDEVLLEDNLMESDIHSDWNHLGLRGQQARMFNQPFLLNSNSLSRSSMEKFAEQTRLNELISPQGQGHKVRLDKELGKNRRPSKAKKPKRRIKKLGFLPLPKYDIKKVVIPRANRKVRHLEEIDITHKRHRRINHHKKSQIFW